MSYFHHGTWDACISIFTLCVSLIYLVHFLLQCDFPVFFRNIPRRSLHKEGSVPIANVIHQRLFDLTFAKVRKISWHIVAMLFQLLRVLPSNFFQRNIKFIPKEHNIISIFFSFPPRLKVHLIFISYPIQAVFLTWVCIKHTFNSIYSQRILFLYHTKDIVVRNNTHFILLHNSINFDIKWNLTRSLKMFSAYFVTFHRSCNYWKIGALDELKFNSRWPASF